MMDAVVQAKNMITFNLGYDMLSLLFCHLSSVVASYTSSSNRHQHENFHDHRLSCVVGRSLLSVASFDIIDKIKYFT